MDKELCAHTVTASNLRSAYKIGDCVTIKFLA